MSMASPQASASEEAEPHLTHHEQLYAMVEFAQVCHFCLTFQAPLKLPAFSRTDLQAAVVVGTKGDDQQVALLAELHFKLVREQGAKLERMLQEWEKALTRKITDNWRLDFDSNPFDGTSYDNLTPAQRIQILNALCHWKLETCAEIQKHLVTMNKETDSKTIDALRSTPIGYDDTGVAYWYFGDDCWVYAEDPAPSQTQAIQEYAVEFADAKRIRLSINFNPSGRSATKDVVSCDDAGAKDSASATRNKMQITALVAEQIDEEEEEDDEPLPIKANDIDESKPAPTTAVDRVKEEKEASSPPSLPQSPPKHRKMMDISALCDDNAPKRELRADDDHNAEEDHFMSTIVSRSSSTVQRVSPDVKAEVQVKPESPKPEPLEKEEIHSDKKRRHSDEVTASVTVPSPVKKKTRFHAISHASDNTNAKLVDADETTESNGNTTVEPQSNPLKSAASEPTEDGKNESDEDFNITCATCSSSHDRRYLDPPLEHRPMGEWRCFECLVNDARGWPRRRPSSSAKSPTSKSTEESDGENSSKNRKSSSHASSSRRSKGKSSSSSSKSGSSKKSSSSSSKHKKSSRSSSKSSSSKKHKRKSSSSSRHHSSSSSSSRHHRHSHREEYVKLRSLAQSRKRERLAIEDERLHGAHLYPVSLEGPTGWRVVCSSVPGLQRVVDSLAGGSLAQDRLRGRLICILKAQEKLELERMKKREQQMWQVLPRRQSSRVAMGRMKSQTTSGESDEDSDDESGRSRRRASLRQQENGGGRERLARDRESRARRRHRDEDSDSGSSSEDDEPVAAHDTNVNGWIDWSRVSDGEGRHAAVCQAAVTRLLKAEIAELFSRPVDPEGDGCPDYLTVITHPMDLGTIQRRVDANEYQTWGQFTSDIDLVWINCRKYNPRDTAIVEYADVLDGMFKRMRREAERKGIKSVNDQSTTGSSRLKKLVDNDEDDEDEEKENLANSSEDEDPKTKSESSASEASSDDDSGDDSSDASSVDDDDEGGRGRKAKRKAPSAKATSRPSSSGRPTRTARAAAAPKRNKPTRRRRGRGSDSEEEEEDDDEESDEKQDDEEEADESDDSASARRKRRGPQRPQTRQLTPRSSTTRQETVSKPVRQAEAELTETPKKVVRWNRIASSDESSSSDDDSASSSSSSSEDSDVDSSKPKSRQRLTATVPAPPPPSSPPPSSPPPPPPPSTTNDSSSKCTSRPPAAPASPAGGSSSSSYFSSSESDLGDSSDSD